MLDPDFGFFLCFLILLFAGCIGGDVRLENYGDMIPRAEVEKSFENYYVDDELDYYVSGPSSAPMGLMGIVKDYTLDTTLWRKVEDPFHTLKELVRNMQAYAADYNLTLHGFDIRNHRGEDIGNWYSVLDGRMPVKITGDNQVSIYPPPADFYERKKFERFDTDDD
jgi:hypothetical protein